MDEARDFSSFPEDAWQALVHVCQRWRFVVFASPHRLDLHILCTKRNQVEKDLNIWPQLPIAIDAFSDTLPMPGATNIIAALKHHDRLSRIIITGVPNSLLEEFGAMAGPFPALTKLALESNEASHASPPVLPDSFLLGSAPRLQSLSLRGISFPALPKLFLSTSDLVELYFHLVPPSGYISPEVLVTSLSVLPRLKILSIDPSLESPPSWADRENQHPPLFTPVLLPSLTNFDFKGHSEYLERIVSQIECPLLDRTWITFFDQSTFDVPQLRHLMNRTEAFKAPHRADIEFSENCVRVALFQRKGIVGRRKLEVCIPCSRPSWQVSTIIYIFSTLLPPLPTLERLDIYEDTLCKPQWQDNVVNTGTQWLQLFYPFTSVKNLFLCQKLARLIVPALQELTGGRVTEVLPALQNIFLRRLGLGQLDPSETVQEAFSQFITERQLSDCPVVVHCEQGGSW